MAAKLIPIITMLLMDDDATVPTSTPMPPKKTGQTTSYYAKDDGDYQAGVTPSYSRSNEVVTDHVTGLEWQDNAEASSITKNWTEA